MEVRQAIDDLHASLERVTVEDELLGIITDRVAVLRQSYPAHRASFTARDIEFLKSLDGVSGQLRSFIETKEELASVNSVKEYEDLVCRLTRAEGSLASFPVTRRIAKEIRALHEKLPVIREHDETNHQFRLSAQVFDLEQKSRRCHRRHPMVIRRGTHGHFWGCSQYPFCCETAQLTREERERLSV
jgi:hypothetical protein